MLSYWEKNIFSANYDCVVVGAGFVGTHAAIQLLKARPKMKVLLVEQSVLGAAASTKNAGFACLGSPSELLENIDLRGIDAVVKLFEWKWKGINKLLGEVGKQKIAFQAVKGYDLFSSITAQDYDSSCERLDILNDLAKSVTGIYPFYEPLQGDLTKLFGFSNFFTKAIQINYEGQLNPAAALRFLHLKAQNLGAQILCGVGVSPNIVASGDGLQMLELTNGLRINTKQVLVCVNGFAAPFLGENSVVPGRGQVVVRSLGANLLRFKGNFHYEGGYTYFRNIGSNKLLIGGGRNHALQTENTTEFGSSAVIQTHLNALIGHILPDQKTQEEANWSGIMGFTPSGLPIIKTVKPGLHCAVGLNGMGVAMGAYVGAQAAKLVQNCQ